MEPLNIPTIREGHDPAVCIFLRQVTGECADTALAHDLLGDGGLLVRAGLAECNGLLRLLLRLHLGLDEGHTDVRR